MHLADVYTDSGRGAEAEPHYLRALDIWERAFGVFGTEHPDVAEGLNALGKLYRDQGRHGEAEPLLTRALAIRQNTLGADHLLTKASREALDGAPRCLAAVTQPVRHAVGASATIQAAPAMRKFKANSDQFPWASG